jgi:hypothetical protein
MAKAGADVIGENQGGFASDDSPIYGFSHMHDSGTGGVSSRQNPSISNPIRLTVLGLIIRKFPHLSSRQLPQ